MQNSKNGFTLIELLIVVLIIGILSAVAIPQYQKAVLKSHFANIKALTFAYVKAAEVYYLANNAWPTKFEDLDVDVPAGSQMANPTSSNCGTSGNIYCCLQETKSGYQPAGITCGKTDYSIGFFRGFGNEVQICEAKDTNGAAIRICADEGGDKRTYNLPTPVGHKTGYISYSHNYN